MAQPDSQQVGVIGHLRVKLALIEAGIEIATPERDNGVDVMAYRWDSRRREYTARPVQIKAASGQTFGVLRKYEAIPRLVMAYVMNVRQPDHALYAMTYQEAVKVAKAMGWTKTASWKKGGYVTTRASVALLAALRRYRVAGPAAWRRFFALGR